MDPLDKCVFMVARVTQHPPVLEGGWLLFCNALFFVLKVTT